MLIFANLSKLLKKSLQRASDISISRGKSIYNGRENAVLYFFWEDFVGRLSTHKNKFPEYTTEIINTNKSVQIIFTIE